MHSNVFVGVFDLRLEFTRPPVVTSFAEKQKYLEMSVAADLIQGSDGAACRQLGQRKAKTAKSSLLGRVGVWRSVRGLSDY